MFKQLELSLSHYSMIPVLLMLIPVWGLVLAFPHLLGFAGASEP